MVATDKYAQLTHPLEQYDFLLEKFEGWIVPLGLTLGFGYEHVAQDTDFNGASIKLNMRYGSADLATSPLISILGNFHQPLTRYKFAAIATSLLIHQQITDEIRFDNLTDIQEADKTLFGAMIWWANNISKLPITGRSKFTSSEFENFKIKLASAKDPQDVLPKLQEDFPNPTWRADLLTNQNIGVPKAFKAPRASTWTNVTLTEDINNYIKVTNETYNPRIWGEIFKKQFFLAAGVAGLNCTTLPIQHKPVGYLFNNGNQIELLHGGDLNFERVYAVGLVGLGAYLMYKSGKFETMDLSFFPILQDHDAVKSIDASPGLNHHNVLLGHAIHWAQEYTNGEVNQFLPRSLTAIYRRFYRNEHDKIKLWENN